MILNDQRSGAPPAFRPGLRDDWSGVTTVVDQAAVLGAATCWVRQRAGGVLSAIAMVAAVLSVLAGSVLATAVLVVLAVLAVAAVAVLRWRAGQRSDVGECQGGCMWGTPKLMCDVGDATPPI